MGVEVTKKRVFRGLNRFGIALTVLGSAGLLLGLAGIIELDNFSYGLSAGVRVMGSLAVSGCLLSAISLFVMEQDD